MALSSPNMALSKGFKLLALKLQERATDLSQNDIRSRISAALKDAAEEAGTWCYILDIFGDDKSGDVVYSCGDDIKRAAYKISATNGATVDMENALDVIPRMTYEGETKKESATEPYMKLFANLPLRESGASFCEEIKLQEASTSDYAVKLIQPGWGSSGYYSPDVLKEDGPKIFTAGTQMFWNHATEAEERARPEGNLDNLAAVLTTNAYYDEAGKQGAGLYARAKVFADYATAVAEKAPHTGLSIRALGQAKEGSAMGRKGNLITSLTKAESVDFVTKAGAGGKVLTESARPTDIKESVMDEAEIKALREAQSKIEAKQLLLEADNRKLRERAAMADASNEGRVILAPMRLDEAVAQRVLARCVARLPLTESGDLNVDEFKKAVVAEATDEQAYISKITGGARVVGMGAPLQEALDPAKDAEDATKSLKESFIAMGYDEKQAEVMAKGRVN